MDETAVVEDANNNEAPAGLAPKTRITGKVFKLMPGAAFVNLGSGQMGLLHISQIGKDRSVTRIQDAFSEGDEVTVWVRRVKDDRVELTMIEPLGMEWGELKRGMTVKGTVVRLEAYGAFVDIGAERPGLIHVREMSTEYVRDPKDILSLGDSVEAQITNVDRRKKKIDLSMKALQEEKQADDMIVEADEQDDFEPMSAMAMALQAALEPDDAEPDRSRRSRQPKKKNKRNKRSNRRFDDYDELFDRTLDGMG